MADLKFQSNPSGTGVFTVQPPNSNTNRTITLPDNEGEILTSATTTLLPKGVPMFSARLGTNQVVSHNSQTLPNYTSEDFDIGGFYDSTSRRFQPTVAGYYSFSHRWVATVVAGRGYYLISRIVKNATSVVDQQSLSISGSGSGAEVGVGVSSLVFLNGTTDFIEPIMYHFDYTASSSITLLSTQFSNFSGFLVSAT